MGRRGLNAFMLSGGWCLLKRAQCCSQAALLVVAVAVAAAAMAVAAAAAVMVGPVGFPWLLIIIFPSFC